MTFKVMTKIDGATKNETFSSYEEALGFFNIICKKRTLGAGIVVLSYNNAPMREYRLNIDYNSERLVVSQKVEDREDVYCPVWTVVELHKLLAELEVKVTRESIYTFLKKKCIEGVHFHGGFVYECGLQMIYEYYRVKGLGK